MTIDTDNTNLQVKDRTDVAITDMSFDIETSLAPLARQHLTHKHHYAQIQSTNDIAHESEKRSEIDTRQASLAVEAAISIVINGIHYAVLMASPQQLEYLAVGFLFSEGLIEHRQDLLDWEITQLTDSASFRAFSEDNIDGLDNYEHLLDYDSYVVELELNQRCHQRIQAQRRQLSGRTGCGMCGMTGLAQALPDLSAYQRSLSLRSRPDLDTLLAIRAQIDTAQHAHQLTGAVHAAATIFEGQLHLFEDVGRHNALDKLIGWQLRQQAELNCVVMTSRLSIELVQKSIRMRLPWLVGMSAPTSTAVRVAERYGLGLAGFLRDNRVTYYSKLSSN